MLADLIRRLAGSTDTRPLPAEDCRRALAALLVRLSRTDAQYSPEEKAHIERVLAARYGLDAAAAAHLRGEAEAIEAQAPDTVRFTRIIKDVVPYEARLEIVDALWTVALADGINADERGFLRLVTNLLGVTDQDSGLCRQRAEQRAGR